VHIQLACPIHETSEGRYPLQHPVILCSQWSWSHKVDELGANKAIQMCSLQTAGSKNYMIMFGKTEQQTTNILY